MEEKKLVLITVVDDQYCGDVFKVDYEAMDKTIRIEADGIQRWYDKGEYIEVNEDEAKEVLFKKVFGYESQFQTEVEEMQDRIDALELTIEGLEEHNQQLIEDLNRLGGNR